MTDLQKIIEKAIKGGWDYLLSKHVNIISDFLVDEGPLLELRMERQDYNLFIFTNEFLKAYFGEGWTKCDCGGEDNCQFIPEQLWQYHAQQLVLAEDRIAYLKQFLN